MTTLVVEQLAERERQAKRQAHADYSALVARANEPQDGDAERLEEICRLLQIEPLEIDIDARAIAEIPHEVYSTFVSR